MTANTEYLFIVNDAPYGNERPYNAFRLAMNLIKREGTQIRIFLMGDGSTVPSRGRKRPMGTTTRSAC